ncbi:MAG: hypothetical protein GY697_00440 [Desulfobacterales bacterium]|nr:hypothetical protein [Desulfobacterales bacterium]
MAQSQRWQRVLNPQNTGMYSSGLKLAAALTLNQNPFFEISFGKELRPLKTRVFVGAASRRDCLSAQLTTFAFDLLCDWASLRDTEIVILFQRKGLLQTGSLSYANTQAAHRRQLENVQEWC